MYEPMEIEISMKYLHEVIAAIEEPIVVLGGWAVYFLVNNKFRELQGRDYIGSRDIDLGFKLDEKDLSKSSFANTYRKLVDELGFRPLAFRLFKEIHSETGEILDAEKAKATPIYQIIPMYVDLIVDTIPAGFKKYFGFTPIDEPILKHIFDNDRYKLELLEFGNWDFLGMYW